MRPLLPISKSVPRSVVSSTNFEANKVDHRAQQAPLSRAKNASQHQPRDKFAKMVDDNKQDAIARKDAFAKKDALAKNAVLVKKDDVQKKPSDAASKNSAIDNKDDAKTLNTNGETPKFGEIAIKDTAKTNHATKAAAVAKSDENELSADASLIETKAVVENDHAIAPNNPSAQVSHELNEVSTDVTAQASNTNETSNLASHAPLNINDAEQVTANISGNISDILSTDKTSAVEGIEKAVSFLNNLSSADLDAMQIEPEQLNKAISTLKSLISKIEDAGLGADSKAVMGEISQFTKNILQNSNTQNKQIVEQLAAITLGNEPIEKSNIVQNMLGATQNIALEQKTNTANVSTQNKTEVATQATAAASQTTNANAEAVIAPKNVDAKVETSNIRQSNTAQTSAQSATSNQAVVQQVQVENKYTQRYNNDTSASTNETVQQQDETTKETRINVAYNNMKSMAQKAPMAYNKSSLEKINDAIPMDFLNQLNIANGQPNGQIAGQENAVTLKLTQANGRLPQNLPVNAMAFQIGKQFNNGKSEFQIRLDPAELGRVNIKLTFKKGGAIKAHMVVERSDVFELMQRDARALEKALSDAGFEGDNVEIDLSLDQDGNGASTFGEEFDNQNNDSNKNQPTNKTSIDDEMQQMVANPVPLHVSSTGIDRII